jgi:hypothetical protein
MKNPDLSKIVEHQSGNASHAPPPSKGLIALTQILESTPELYHMDVDNDFLEPSWKLIQPSPILLLAHHKLQFHYLIKDKSPCPPPH